jgi:replication-associated recombination protein RarA
MKGTLDFQPTKIEDFVADSEREIAKLNLVVKNFDGLLNGSKNVILLHGTYGAGKTSLAKLIPDLIERQLVEKFDEREFSEVMKIFISCNLSDGRPLFHERIFSSVSLNKSGIQYIIFDEVDCLRIDAQRKICGALTRFRGFVCIMTTSHLKKLDEGLISRSHCVSFEHPNEQQWITKCTAIARELRLNVREDWIKDMVKRNRGDVRGMLTELEIESCTQNIVQ